MGTPIMDPQMTISMAAIVGRGQCRMSEKSFKMLGVTQKLEAGVSAWMEGG